MGLINIHDLLLEELASDVVSATHKVVLAACLDYRRPDARRTDHQRHTRQRAHYYVHHRRDTLWLAESWRTPAHDVAACNCVRVGRTRVAAPLQPNTRQRPHRGKAQGPAQAPPRQGPRPRAGPTKLGPMQPRPGPTEARPQPYPGPTKIRPYATPSRPHQGKAPALPRQHQGPARQHPRQANIPAPARGDYQNTPVTSPEQRNQNTPAPGRFLSEEPQPL